MDGELTEIRHGMKVDRYKTHFIEIVIDKLEVSGKDKDRLKALFLCNATWEGYHYGAGKPVARTWRYFAGNLCVRQPEISYNEPAPHSFSFNSPQWCL